MRKLFKTVIEKLTRIVQNHFKIFSKELFFLGQLKIRFLACLQIPRYFFLLQIDNLIITKSIRNPIISGEKYHFANSLSTKNGGEKDLLILKLLY